MFTLLFQPLMSPCRSGETHGNKSSQNVSQVCSQLLLSARCSGTMTSILLDISVEIRIFLKKDISHRKGFRLISLSRSNRISLMFGYAGMKVAGLERCAGELQFCQCYFQDRLLALWFTLEL